MLLIHGIYRWAPRMTGYRDGWCNHCRQVTHALQVKTWNVFHLYWVPVLPLGRYTALHCAVCKLDPTSRVSEPPALLFIGIVCFSLIFAAVMFAAFPPADQQTAWIVRAVMLGLIIVCAYKLRQRWKRPLPTAAAYIYPDSLSKFCQNPLVPMHDSWYCEPCRLVRIDPYPMRLGCLGGSVPAVMHHGGWPALSHPAPIRVLTSPDLQGFGGRPAGWATPDWLSRAASRAGTRRTAHDSDRRPRSCPNPRYAGPWAGSDARSGTGA